MFEAVEAGGEWPLRAYAPRYDPTAGQGRTFVEQLYRGKTVRLVFEDEEGGVEGRSALTPPAIRPPVWERKSVERLYRGKTVRPVFEDVQGGSEDWLRACDPGNPTAGLAQRTFVDLLYRGKTVRPLSVSGGKT